MNENAANPLDQSETIDRRDEPRRGIGFWMDQVLVEREKAMLGFDEEPVHDLRVAIRRCRTMSQELRQLDPSPVWRKINREGRALFRELGDLRDVQVMAIWLEKLAPADDPVRVEMLRLLGEREAELKVGAAAAVQAFPVEKWQVWRGLAEQRFARLEGHRAAFLHQALRRWIEVRDLHRMALRNRSRVAYHQLRIGVKRFRYSIENFLPELYERWGRGLKRVQDALGEVHDFDVLAERLPASGAVFDTGARARWRSWIREAREKRIEAYRARMVGRGSLLQRWRAGLPQGQGLDEVSLDRIRVWADVLDESPARTARLVLWALSIWDLLAANGMGSPFEDPHWRRLLEASCRLGGVGKGSRWASRKAVSRELRKLGLPVGWSNTDFELMEGIVRLVGAQNPARRSKNFLLLPLPLQRDLMASAGVIRLARAVAGLENPPEIMFEETQGLLLRCRFGAEGEGFFELSEARTLLEWAGQFGIRIDSL